MSNLDFYYSYFVSVVGIGPRTPQMGNFAFRCHADNFAAVGHPLLQNWIFKTSFFFRIEWGIIKKNFFPRTLGSYKIVSEIEFKNPFFACSEILKSFGGMRDKNCFTLKSEGIRKKSSSPLPVGLRSHSPGFLLPPWLYQPHFPSITSRKIPCSSLNC